MINWKEYGGKRLWPNLRSCSGVYSEGLGRNRFKRHDKRCSGRGSKRVPPEYRSEALVLEPGSAVVHGLMVLNDDCE